MKESAQIPLAYLITFTCYGTRLHGDKTGSVDRQHNAPGSPFLLPNPKRVLARTRQLSGEPRELRAQERELILEAIRSGCASRGWDVLAVHVRTAHVHLVVAGEETPEKMMTAAKAYASRALNARQGKETRKWWTRHGSTRYLWRPEDVSAAIHYVVEEQGEPMAAWPLTVSE